MVTYTVCDRCKQEKPIISKIKIKDKEYELCESCSISVSNYIQFSFKEPKGLEKLGKIFTGE